MKIEVNDKCPTCGFAAMPADAENGDAVLCGTCGAELEVCGRFINNDTVFRAWLETVESVRNRIARFKVKKP